MGWGGGSSTRKVGDQKVRSLRSKVCFPWVLRKGTWDVLGILPGCPGPGCSNCLWKKKFVLIMTFFGPQLILSDKYPDLALLGVKMQIKENHLKHQGFSDPCEPRQTQDTS